MAAFNLTAEIQLQAPNTKGVASQIQRDLNGIKLNIDVGKNARNLASLQQNLNGLAKQGDRTSKSFNILSRNVAEAARRFSVITVATGSFIALARGVKTSIGSAIEFQRELVKISQVTGKSIDQLKGLQSEVTRLSTTLGVSNAELLQTSRVLAQAGLSALKTRQALDVLAQTTLAPTFDTIIDTTEGAIAILNQFGRQAAKTGNDIRFLEESLDAINAVSKNFAVESSDLIATVRRTGGVFEAAGGNLKELIALFTSVRQTTREGAETIATGFRTIFTRLQRKDTIEALNELGISLQDAEGKFIGPLKAIEKLAIGLSGLDPKDVRFNEIVEQLGGFRQIGKVIPLIKQFQVTQQALAVANNSVGSTSKDAQEAQKALSVQLGKTRESFDALIRKFTDSSTFQDSAKFVLKLANTFLKFAESLETVLPLLTQIAAIKLGRSLAPGLSQIFGRGAQKRNAGGKILGFNSGGVVPGSGNRDTVPAMLTPGEFVIRKSSVNKLGAGTLAAMNENRFNRGARIKEELDQQRKTDVFDFKEGATIKAGKGGSGSLKAALTQADLQADVDPYQAVFLRPEAKGKQFNGEISASNLKTAVKEAIEGTNIPKTELGTANQIAERYAKRNKFTLTAGSLAAPESARLEGTLLDGVFETAKRGAKDINNSLGIQGEKNIATALRSANIDQVLGNLFEVVLSNAGAPFGMPDTDPPNAPFDFPSGLGDIAKKFGLQQGIETEAKSFFSGDNLATINKKIQNQLINESIDELRAIYRQNLTGSKEISLDEAKKAFGSTRLNKDDVTRLAEERGLDFTGLGGGKYTLNKKNAGGGISGSDTVPALLTPGEFVMNKSASQSIGYTNLNRMNKHGVQGYADGGIVGFQSYATGTGTLGARSAGAVNFKGINSITGAVSRLSKSLAKMGVSVDNQIPVLKKFEEELKNGVKASEAIARTFEDTDINVSKTSDKPDGSSDDLREALEGVADSSEEVSDANKEQASKIRGIGETFNKVSTAALAISFAGGTLIESFGGITEEQKVFSQAVLNTVSANLALGGQFASLGYEVAAQISTSSILKKSTLQTALALDKLTGSATKTSSTGGGGGGGSAVGSAAGKALGVAATAVAVGFIVSSIVKGITEGYKAVERLQLDAANKVADKQLEALEEGRGASEKDFVSARQKAAGADLNIQRLEEQGSAGSSAALTTGVGVGIAGLAVSAGSAAIAASSLTGSLATAAVYVNAIPVAGQVASVALIAAAAAAGVATVAFYAAAESEKEKAEVNELLAKTSKNYALTQFRSIKAAKALTDNLQSAADAGASASTQIGILASATNNAQSEIKDNASRLSEATEQEAELRKKLIDQGVLTEKGNVSSGADTDDDSIRDQIKDLEEATKQREAAEKADIELIKKTTQQAAVFRTLAQKVVSEGLTEIGKLGPAALANINGLDGLAKITPNLSRSIAVANNEFKELKNLELKQALEGETDQGVRNALTAKSNAELELSQQELIKSAQEQILAQQRVARASLLTEQAERQKALTLLKVNKNLSAFNLLLLQSDKLSGLYDAVEDFGKGGSFGAVKFDTSIFDITFKQLNDKAIERINNLGRGAIGKDATGFAKNIRDVKNITKGLPSVFESFRRSGKDSEIVDIPTLKKQLSQQIARDVPGGLGGLGGDIRAIIEKNADEAIGSGIKGSLTFESQEKLNKELEEAIQGQIDVFKRGVEIQNQFLQKLADLDSKIISAQGRIIDAQVRVSDAFERNADRLADASGRPRSRQEKEAGRLRTASIGLGATARQAGARAGDVTATAKAFKRLTLESRNLREKQRQLARSTSPNPKTTNMIAKLGSSANDAAKGAARAKAELERLADQSARAADVEKDLTKLREKRSEAESLQESVAFGSDEQRQEIFKGFRLLNQSIMQGGIQGANSEQRASIGNALDSIGSQLINFEGQQVTGKELKQIFAARETGRLGAFGLNNFIDNLRKAENPLLGELKDIAKTELMATAALAMVETQELRVLKDIRTALVGTFPEELANAQNDAANDLGKGEEDAGRGIAANQDTLVKLNQTIATQTKRVADLTEKMAEKQGINIEAIENLDRARQRQKEAQNKSRGGPIYMNDGGVVPGSAPTPKGMEEVFKPKGTDNVPAYLSEGEFVIKKSSVDKIGTDALHQINNGGTVYADGGGSITEKDLMSAFGVKPNQDKVDLNEYIVNLDQATARANVGEDIKDTLQNVIRAGSVFDPTGATDAANIGISAARIAFGGDPTGDLQKSMFTDAAFAATSITGGRAIAAGVGAVRRARAPGKYVGNLAPISPKVNPVGKRVVSQVDDPEMLREAIKLGQPGVTVAQAQASKAAMKAAEPATATSRAAQESSAKTRAIRQQRRIAKALGLTSPGGASAKAADEGFAYGAQLPQGGAEMRALLEGKSVSEAGAAGKSSASNIAEFMRTNEGFQQAVAAGARKRAITGAVSSAAAPLKAGVGAGVDAGAKGLKKLLFGDELHAGLADHLKNIFSKPTTPANLGKQLREGLLSKGLPPGAVKASLLPSIMQENDSNPAAQQFGALGGGVMMTPAQIADANATDLVDAVAKDYLKTVPKDLIKDVESEIKDSPWLLQDQSQRPEESKNRYGSVFSESNRIAQLRNASATGEADIASKTEGKLRAAKSNKRRSNPTAKKALELENKRQNLVDISKLDDQARQRELVKQILIKQQIEKQEKEGNERRKKDKQKVADLERERELRRQDTLNIDEKAQNVLNSAKDSAFRSKQRLKEQQERLYPDKTNNGPSMKGTDFNNKLTKRQEADKKKNQDIESRRLEEAIFQNSADKELSNLDQQIKDTGFNASKRKALEVKRDQLLYAKGKGFTQEEYDNNLANYNAKQEAADNIRKNYYTMGTSAENENEARQNVNSRRKARLAEQRKRLSGTKSATGMNKILPDETKEDEDGFSRDKYNRLLRVNGLAAASRYATSKNKNPQQLTTGNNQPGQQRAGGQQQQQILQFIFNLLKQGGIDPIELAKGFNKGGGTVDNVPAMLTEGEFVMNAKSSADVGLSNLKYMNENGAIPEKFAKGGVVGGVKTSYLRRGGSPRGSGGPLEINTGSFSEVLDKFSAAFGSRLDNMVLNFDVLGNAMNNLSSVITQGMKVNHSFSGDMTMTFNLPDSAVSDIVKSVADAITPKMKESIKQEVDKRFNPNSFNGGQ